MHRLNFQLNSRTRFLNHIKRAKSTRELLRLIVERRQEQQQALIEKQGQASIRRSTSPATRRLFDKTLTSSTPVGAPTNYMGYVISIVCPAPWAWVACFARADGRSFFIEETSQVFAETGPHPAKVLALSDAMLLIDRLVEAEAQIGVQPETLI